MSNYLHFFYRNTCFCFLRLFLVRCNLVILGDLRIFIAPHLSNILNLNSTLEHLSWYTLRYIHVQHKSLQQPETKIRYLDHKCNACSSNIHACCWYGFCIYKNNNIQAHKICMLILQNGSFFNIKMSHIYI